MSRFHQLTEGQHGEAIRDLQRRLGGAGFAPFGAESGTFDAITANAVRAFQRHRGLTEHGRCDEQTWLALVEASWRLGDRPLKLVAPNLRGDDVGTLQSLLGKLGFDCGHIDAIFGPQTAKALEDFQRNCGLDVDGVCGPQTTRALAVISTKTGTGPGVATLREFERLGKVGGSLREQRIVVGQYGGLGAVARLAARDLRIRGARVITVDELDQSLQAAAANRYDASVYLGLRADAAMRATISYYSTEGFTSAGGKSLASNLACTLDATGVLGGQHAETAGVRMAVLRQTRMTAVVCSLGPVKRITDAAGLVSAAIVQALTAWTASPTELVPANR